jgi:Tol biopolymer transport system component
MSERDDLDRMLLAWLDDPYTPPAPGYLGEVLKRTRRTRQRPAWASLERWLPMADRILRPATAAPMRMVWLLLIALVVIALAAGVALVGSNLLRSSGPAIPKGGAAVLVFDTGDDTPGGAGPARLKGDIYTVRADGTDLRQLTNGPDVESLPVWSPDGSRIAYLVSNAAGTSLAVMDAGGGSRKTLVPASGTGQNCIDGAPAWSPDGKSLVFPTSAACDNKDALSIVAADGSSGATPLLAPGLGGTWAIWSADGTKVAFAGQDATGAGTGLYVVDVGAGDGMSGGLTARRISAAGSTLAWLNAHWSPDGTEVAAAAGTNSDCVAATLGTLDIFAVKADGSGQRTLAADPAKEYNPIWSPDGRQIAFQRIVAPAEYVNGRPCTMATWVMNADGTNPHRLPGLGTDAGQAPLWSPDGTRLVGNTVRVVSGTEHYDMYIVTADGSSPIVTVDDVGIATWQPVAAPLPPAPSFAAGSSTP